MGKKTVFFHKQLSPEVAALLDLSQRCSEIWKQKPVSLGLPEPKAACEPLVNTDKPLDEGRDMQHMPKVESATESGASEQPGRRCLGEKALQCVNQKAPVMRVTDVRGEAGMPQIKNNKENSGQRKLKKHQLLPLPESGCSVSRDSPKTTETGDLANE